MWVRTAVVTACFLGSVSAIAEELRPDEARAFVVGKLFAYTCFDGTAGMARMHIDGSVVGTVQPRGQGQIRFANLPPGSIKISTTSMCARVPKRYAASRGICEVLATSPVRKAEDNLRTLVRREGGYP